MVLDVRSTILSHQKKTEFKYTDTINLNWTQSVIRNVEGQWISSFTSQRHKSVPVFNAPQIAR